MQFSCGWLRQAVAVAICLLLVGDVSELNAGGSGDEEITWQIEIDAAVTSDQMSQPGWEEDARALESALTARLESHGTRLDTRRAPTPRGAEVTFRADGKGTAAQFRRVVFEDLSPVGGLVGGLAVLRLQGEVNRGENLSLVLESNPSTGYAWEVSQMDPALQSAGVPQVQSKANMPGAPATQTIRLNGAEDGAATLALTYRRPFEIAMATRRVTLSAARLALLTDISSPIALPAAQIAPADLPVRAPESPSVLPETFNWASADNWKGAPQVTPIRNQGACGSCWAFATVAPLESNILIKDGMSQNLSEQFLVSCDEQSYGCYGGWWAHNYHHTTVASGDSVAGAVLESAFPYTASDAPCLTPYNHPYRLSNWFYVGNLYSLTSVDAIKNAIYNYGPVTAAVCAGSGFGSYKGGIFSGNDCPQVGINHGITLVGWNDAENTWILRNSWGTGWGESAMSGGERGYMRITRNASQVGYAAAYVIYNGTAACYNLATASSPGNGGGVVTSPAPNCNGAQYTQGTVVTVTAMPACGHTFASWSGALSGAATPATVTMSGAKSVTASFAPVPSTCFYIQLPFVLR